MIDLVVVTADLGESYVQWKESEKAKNDDRDEFFASANQALSEQPVAERLIEAAPVGEEDEEALLERIKRFNPGWKIDEFRARLIDGKPFYEFILIEDYTLKAFTYVNKANGNVYTRQVSQGKAQIDDEYMRQNDPDLYEQITFELPWGERVMVPLTTLDKETVSKVQKYMYHDKPSVKLAPPREAKPEELE